MSPTKEQLTVATNALRTDASVWDAQSTAIGDVVPKVQDLRLSRIEAGVFQVMVRPYDDVAEELTNRCGEGKARMIEIADTLHTVADTYDAEEAKNMHALRNLY